MAIKKFAVAAYDDEEVLFPAVKSVRKRGYKIHDIYTPFAVHGLDEAMGLKGTDLHIAGFIYGLCGTSTAVGFISWIYCSDWPINYGGKPHFALPAWIPITFELTVLFAAVGMTMTFCYLNQIMPGVKKHVFHPRQSDDLFVMAIEINKHAPEAEVLAFLKSTGAKETYIQTAEAGWWYGRWDKKEPYELSAG
jgi:ActD protein